MPTGPKKKQAIPSEERLKVVKRLEAGETQSAVATDYGVTRQYISLLWKAFREMGDEGLLKDGSGRKKTKRLTAKQRSTLSKMVEGGDPSDYGLKGDIPFEGMELWTVEALRELTWREFGFVPNKGDVKTILIGRGLPVPIGERTVGKVTIDPKAPRGPEPAVKTPKAAKVARPVAKRPKVARKTREIDVSEVDEEELERIRRRIEAGEPLLPPLPGADRSPGPGVRVGKNRGSKAGQARKKKRRK